MGCIALIVWFLLWIGDHHPYLLNSWNPWNVSLLVIAFYNAIASRRAITNRGGSK